MKPYPRNKINYIPITPIYAKQDTAKQSRYSPYRLITNLDPIALEIKLTNSISSNETYRGYYYTTSRNETLYEIAKNYYNSESYWWIIAKANGLKNDGVSILSQGVTLRIPLFSELTRQGGYFNNVN